jgi:putative acetyltransferase
LVNIAAMQIRPADLSDPRIAALLHVHLSRARAVSPPQSTHALDLSGLAAPDIRLWAAWDGDALLGVGALKALSADHGEIKSMHVAEARRGCGVGAAIVGHIVAAAWARGMTRLSLETGSMAYFAPARALYAKAGFCDCPPFADYGPDPHSTFMTLVRRAPA